MIDVVNFTTWAFVVNDPTMRMKPGRGDVVSTKVLQERRLVPARRFPVEKEFPDGVPVKGLVLVDDIPLPKMLGNLVVDKLLVVLSEMFFNIEGDPAVRSMVIPVAEIIVVGPVCCQPMWQRAAARALMGPCLDLLKGGFMFLAIHHILTSS